MPPLKANIANIADIADIRNMDSPVRRRSAQIIGQAGNVLL